jgi:hypothetical protein
MLLHYLEKKYGIGINLVEWSGDDYETGTLNAVIKEPKKAFDKWFGKKTQK